MDKLNFEDIRAFVCVPAVGKTYLCEHNDNFVDMDELKARYKYAQEDVPTSEIEWLKGNRGSAVRKDSVDYIKSKTLELLKTTNKKLLFAPNPDIVNLLTNNNIPYCLVFHSKDCLDEIEQRMKARGNQENFIRAMLDPIDQFYENSINDTRPCTKIELQSGEFLSDIFDDPQKFLSRKIKPSQKKVSEKELSL